MDRDAVVRLADESGMSFALGFDAFDTLDIDYTETVTTLERFANLVRDAALEEAATVSPNGLDISAAAGPAEVWEKHVSAIRAMKSRQIA